MQIRHALVLAALKISIILGYSFGAFCMAWGANEILGLRYAIGFPIGVIVIAVLFFFDAREERSRKILLFPISRYLRKRNR